MLLFSSGIIDHVITILTAWLFIVVGKKPSAQCNVHWAEPTFSWEKNILMPRLHLPYDEYTMPVRCPNHHFRAASAWRPCDHRTDLRASCPLRFCLTPHNDKFEKNCKPVDTRSCSIQLCAIGTSQRHYDVTLLTSLLSYIIIVMLLLIY